MRTIFSLVVALLTATLANGIAAESRPNILFIYTDDHSHRTDAGFVNHLPNVRVERK